MPALLLRLSPPPSIQAVGDDLIDAVIGGNVAVLAGEEKYNETVTSSLNRIVSVIEGKADPGGPVRDEGVRKRTYKTKEETEKTKSVTGTIVLTLLFIAFVVPMLQVKIGGGLRVECLRLRAACGLTEEERNLDTVCAYLRYN